ncbi:CGNR zinc finger domain-containing protein [Actinosynnema pretiosum]|uniref:Zinc finger CGNR domain-containing protein n=1 Tax=Actinosynnema pretiosum TaxID=42197 RepID=A0A290Z277_9PSEU|nr:ABATE domain-containing protein [Actinosynnema pretiosum]ATE53102.1 hypothetical protein CNX65_07215 [Actinosynnema pretiosum]
MRVLDFVGTLHGDGRGGLVDELGTPEGFARWLGRPGDEELRARALELRAAVRALLAHVTGAGERLDAPLAVRWEQALDVVNRTAALAPRVARLEWADGPKLVHLSEAGARDRLLADLATGAIELLAGGGAAELRACPSPRCVRYFVRSHPQQVWCLPSCGNRARVSRHHRRKHA